MDARQLWCVLSHPCPSCGFIISREILFGDTMHIWNQHSASLNVGMRVELASGVFFDFSSDRNLGESVCVSWDSCGAIFDMRYSVKSIDDPLNSFSGDTV